MPFPHGMTASPLRWMVLMVLLVSRPTGADSSTCGNALLQFQAYVAQVNQVANWELLQGIPMRCGWNGLCVQAMRQQLDLWYAHQSNLANNQYAQIVRLCTRMPAPRPGHKIDIRDPGAVEKITIDEEDRAVVIRIPDTPEGFRP